MKHLLIASLLLCLTASAHAQTALDVQIAIAIANANAEAQVPAVACSPAKPAAVLTLRSELRPAKSTPARSGYPVRSGWWTGCPNWTHLTRGEHAGQFDHAWLQSLSNAEIQSLHADDHEGRTKWAYVVRPSASKSSAVTYQKSSSGSCPTGNCPNTKVRVGFFGRRR
jgi:hypothetical protein